MSSQDIEKGATLDFKAALLVSLGAMAVWELGRRSIVWFLNWYRKRDALKELFALSGPTTVARSIVGGAGARNVREPDARVAGQLARITKVILDLPPNLAEVRFHFEDPSRNLVIIGSPRYNELAELLQRKYSLPYQYVVTGTAKDPALQVLTIVTDYGDQLTASRDTRAEGSELEVDYGIILFSKLPNEKRGIWLGGIHGPGTLGAFHYLTSQSQTVLDRWRSEKNDATTWLVRVRYRVERGEVEIYDSEALGRPRSCQRRERSAVPRVLICDLGNVLMYFDRSRTYRSLAHYFDWDLSRVTAAIEGTDLRERYEKGELDDSSFCDELNDLFSGPRKLDFSLLSEFWGDMFWPNAEMLATLQKLKRDERVSLVLLSNTNSLHFEYVNRHYPEVVELFDECVLSFKEGFAKPEVEIFERAMAAARNHRPEASAGELIFVDDSAEFAEIASRMGMRALAYRSHAHFVFWLRGLGLYVP